NEEILNSDALRRIWDSIRKKFNLDKSFRSYDATRHPFASNLINQNVPISKCQNFWDRPILKQPKDTPMSI
ncbi:MAG: hypothetical protein NZ583_07940, partial [Desulfobacterota bacterium]|nr:hypothetical protein [Thermodesulfobacteriota bacterium]